jgi:hypothetical protein
VSAAGETPDTHPRRQTGLNAVHAVFDHETIARRDIERLCGVKEQIGCGLGVRDVIRRIDVRREVIPQPRLAQLVFELPGLARACDRFRTAKLRDGLFDPGNRREALLAYRTLSRIHTLAEGVRQIAVQARNRILRQRGIERVVTHAHKAGNELRLFIVQAVLGQQRALNLDRDDLAVHQNTVAIEDDGLQLGTEGIGFSDFSLKSGML